MKMSSPMRLSAEAPSFQSHPVMKLKLTEHFAHTTTTAKQSPCQAIALYYTCGCKDNIVYACILNECTHSNPTLIVGGVPFACLSRPKRWQGPREARCEACKVQDPANVEFLREVDSANRLNNFFTLSGYSRKDIEMMLPPFLNSEHKVIIEEVKEPIERVRVDEAPVDNSRKSKPEVYAQDEVALKESESINEPDSIQKPEYAEGLVDEPEFTEDHVSNEPVEEAEPIQKPECFEEPKPLPEAESVTVPEQVEESKESESGPTQDEETIEIEPQEFDQIEEPETDNESSSSTDNTEEISVQDNDSDFSDFSDFVTPESTSPISEPPAKDETKPEIGNIFDDAIKRSKTPIKEVLSSNHHHETEVDISDIARNIESIPPVSSLGRSSSQVSLVDPYSLGVGLEAPPPAYIAVRDRDASGYYLLSEEEDWYLDMRIEEAERRLKEEEQRKKPKGVVGKFWSYFSTGS